MPISQPWAQDRPLLRIPWNASMARHDGPLTSLASPWHPPWSSGTSHIPPRYFWSCYPVIVQILASLDDIHPVWNHPHLHHSKSGQKQMRSFSSQGCAGAPLCILCWAPILHQHPVEQQSQLLPKTTLRCIARAFHPLECGGFAVTGAVCPRLSGPRRQSLLSPI